MTLLRVAGVVAALSLLAVVAAAAYAVSRQPDRALVLTSTPSEAAPVPPAAAAPAGVTRPAGPPQVSPAWVATHAARTGIPAPALTAYADAVLRASCPVGWTTLAGIGWVESQHGTIGGRVLSADGRPDRPILGPPLDGRGGTAAVPDGSGGWVRAEGPMQFLPSTWARWGTDADGDGVADPQDLDDAALAAARYLCASGADLGTGAGWQGAVRSYNHADRYVRAVRTAAATYATRAGS